MLLPSGAVVIYALMAELNYGDPVLDTIYWVLVTTTFSAGTLAAIWAIATAWRQGRTALPVRSSTHR